MPKMIMKCEYCNNDYMGGIYPSRSTKYCSRKCMSSNFIIELVDKLCIRCGNSFKVENSRKYRAKFCSPKCIMYTGPKESLSHSKGKGFWQIADNEQKLTKIKELFEKTVIKKDGCWEWRNSKLRSGYGSISIGRHKFLSAHRVSWIIHYGEIPEGLLVCHRCDNKECTNPEHLFLGTYKDNSIDCVNKNRKNMNFGVNHYSAKLNDEKVRSIKKLLIENNTWRSIAEMYNVSISTIQNIVKGKTWKHIV